ncbi:MULTISPECIES: hypothetical protein [Sinorhizobium]|uniref:hypothetical protein n=1 Tax=Sinorhizobium TaxID=28105 RepID=UPI000BEA06A5|nr:MULTISPECIES: hypothetical protein [Sinorhizobium]PDT50588.1 hypothetical protein CO664_25465 [Sinorhizobium sp. NG07B]POH33869.1 hypothetical protein ATY30_00655 [Sinorhizobium americanum]
MRLIFIHGINNESLTVEQIRNSWFGALEDGWQRLGLTTPSQLSIEAAYYADILAQASGNRPPAVEMGLPVEANSCLAIEFLRSYAEMAGVSEHELREAAVEEGLPQEAVAQGIPHEGWVIAFARALEHVLPTKGKYVAKHFLRQAAIYIGDSVLAEKIADTVAKQVFYDKPDPMVIIGHSLGSVVGYRLLASDSMMTRDIPLFVTLGSPLSVDMFKPMLPKRGLFPNPPMARWLNGRNENDFVTLGKPINKKSIGFEGVDDEIDVVDNSGDRHDIHAYLRSPKIAQAIHDAVTTN